MWGLQEVVWVPAGPWLTQVRHLLGEIPDAEIVRRSRVSNMTMSN
jgi:hypothetical protein